MVRYVQLAHNERHPVTGSPVAKVIHNFGRADQVDRQALARLVASIFRFLDVDIIFVDTTSTYWELEVAAELPRSPMARTVTMIACRRRGPGGSGTPRTTATTCRRR